MPSKYIVAPEAIELLNPEDGESVKGTMPITMAEFVRRALLPDQRFVTTQEGLEARIDVIEAFKKMADGVVELSVSVHETLAAVAKNPMAKWDPAMQRTVQGYGYYNTELLDQLYPFISAIRSATDKAPKKVEAKPEEAAPPIPEAAPAPVAAQA